MGWLLCFFGAHAWEISPEKMNILVPRETPTPKGKMVEERWCPLARCTRCGILAWL